MSRVNRRAYRLGRLPFALSGEGECVDYLHSEFAPLLELHAAGDDGNDAERSRATPRVDFEFERSLPPMTSHTLARPVSVADDSFRVAYRGLEYHVGVQAARDDGWAGVRTPSARGGRRAAAVFAPLYLALRQINEGRRDRFSVALQRARDPGYLSIDERAARGFMYDVFDYIAQIAQLPLGQSFIHASTLERDGEGTAIVAWSSTGKTAALLELITEHEFNYLSDDIALVDDSGILWRTPKRIQIKGINVSGAERLRSMLLDGRSALDRFSWRQRHWRHGHMGVRRRVSAEELFGAGSVARSARLHRVCCLERAHVPDFEVSEIAVSELCRRAAEVMMDTIEPFTFLSQAIQSCHRTPIFPTHVQVLEETRAVLARAFGSVPVFNVRIPLAAPPAALAEYLVGLIEGSGIARRLLSIGGGVR